MISNRLGVNRSSTGIGSHEDIEKLLAMGETLRETRFVCDSQVTEQDCIDNLVSKINPFHKTLEESFETEEGESYSNATVSNGMWYFSDDAIAVEKRCDINVPVDSSMIQYQIILVEQKFSLIKNLM